MTEIQREPIIINIDGVTKSGGYYLFSNPGTENITPQGKGIRERILWCCYCAKYSTFIRLSDDTTATCECCGISTNDYHIKSENNMWIEDISLADLKKMDMGAMVPTNNTKKKRKQG